MRQHSAKNLPSPSLMSMTRLILDNGTRRICLYGLPLLSFIACKLLVVLGLFRELNALERFLHTYTKQTITKVKFTLEQAMKTQRGRRGILSWTLVLGGGWKLNTTPQPLDPEQRDLVPVVQKTGWVQGLIWMGMWNLTPKIHVFYFEFQISCI